MIINENGFITDNPNNIDENINSHIKNLDEKININPNTSEINDSKNDELNHDNEKNENNCLALTVRKDYNVSIMKNSVFTSLRLTVKIAITTLALNILKLFL